MVMVLEYVPPADTDTDDEDHDAEPPVGRLEHPNVHVPELACIIMVATPDESVVPEYVVPPLVAVMTLPD